MIIYQNKEGYIINIESFKRLNKGKALSKSQMGLLGLKKIKIKERNKTNDIK
jgi:hypothetical protein